MANVLGAAPPAAMSVDERVHHLFARFPDVKVHLYGKAERPAARSGTSPCWATTGRGAREGGARRRVAVDGGVGRRLVADTRRGDPFEKGGVRLSRSSE